MRLTWTVTLATDRISQVPEKGNWTKAHFSPYKFSGSSIGKGLSSARSGFDPF